VLSQKLTVVDSGTSAHLVKIFDFDGREISRLEPYSGFLGHKAAPLASTAFHPHRMLLACAARGDHHVSLYSCGKDKASPF
jgi:regulator-associated protein of mTOR